ncbi:MAG: protein BatD, partial [Gammaproteobacteria bacterium]|nr:protein BatD [Gammaproteobacteria bacterium]
MVGLHYHALVLASLLWLLAMPVIAQGQLPSDPTQPFIEVELEPKSVYVQSMVHYTIRLYRNSHLQRGYFMDQEIPDTVTEFSHDTPARYVTRAGREYELLERHYLLFPQRSGDITLPAAIFSSSNLFIQGTAPTLTVRPRPDS